MLYNVIIWASEWCPLFSSSAFGIPKTVGVPIVVAEDRLAMALAFLRSSGNPVWGRLFECQKGSKSKYGVQ